MGNEHLLFFLSADEDFLMKAFLKETYLTLI